MIQATYRKKGIRITQVWYPDGENHKFTGTDLVFYHAVDKEDNGKNRMATMFHTLMSDLLLPEEELQSRINKNVRYEIRRNNKEEVEFRHFTSKELQENSRVQEEFAHMYELMYEEKGMKAVFNRPQLAA